MVNTMTDPNSNTTTYTYDPTFAGAFVTKTQLPDTSTPSLAHHITQDWYDFDTGLVAWHEDENSEKTSYSYDSMERVQTITPPSAGGVVTFYYNDTPGSLSVERTEQIDSSRQATEYALYDGLGREISRSTANDESTPWDKVDTCYDVRGLKSFVSYPYQTSTYNAARVCSGAGDSYSYDALKRPLSVTHSDSSSVAYSYTGAVSSVTDESGFQHITQVDGLGRKLSVCEVTSTALTVGSGPTPAACGQNIAATGFLTTYQYDGLDNLISVSQGSLNPRTFTYDSLSRLITATNPESGTTCYGTWSGSTCVTGYDFNGNLLKRTKPAPNQTGSTTITATMKYDALNRLYNETYSDGTTPAVTMNYDETSAMGQALTNTTGRRSSEYTGASTAPASQTAFSYDNMGRVLNDYQCTPKNCGTRNFPFAYSYDLLGNSTSYGNGNGTTFTASFNRDSRLTQITSNWLAPSQSGTVLTGVHYNAFGKPTAATLGNAASETYGYTPRGWVQSLNVTGSPATPGTGSVQINPINGVDQSVTSPGTGTVTIGGGPDQSKTLCTKTGCSTLYDAGTVTVTVNGVASSGGYGKGSTTSTIASAIATAINSQTGAFVTATASGATVTLTTKTGMGGNYSLSVSVISGNPVQFPIPSFTASASGPTLTGYGTVTYDSGTVSITINGSTKSVSYGQGSTSASVASALAAAWNGPLVTAVASGNTVQLKSIATGFSANYTLSATAQTNNPTLFSSPSFSPSSSGSTLTGGAPAGTNPGTTMYSYSITKPNSGGAMGYAPNGDLLYATDGVNGQWAYTYDGMDRLSTSTCSASCPGNQSSLAFSYTYDRYGNRWQQKATAGTGTWNQPSYTFDNNNRMTGSGFTYDAAGNLINDGIHTYTYDGENRIWKVDNGTTATYAYDAEGRRISKVTSSTSYEYLFDLSGRVVTELLAGTATTNRSEGYAGGRHLITQNSSTTYFIHADWLGTERMRSNLSGAGCESIISLPYGDSQSTSGSCGDPSPLHFTGKERDSETALDDFPARNFSSAQGRWYTPDWSPVPVAIPYANLSDPRTLNLYDYVDNDPTNHADADGHWITPGYTFATEVAGAIKDIHRDEEEDADPGQADSKSATGQQPQSTGRQPDGSYIADLNSKEIKSLLDPNHKSSEKDVVGPNGECVDLTKKFSGMGKDDVGTYQWKKGSKVDKDTKPGTAIATFNDKNRYPSKHGWNSGIYLGRGDHNSIWILDQWPGHSPESRQLYPDNNAARPENANAYSVILVEPK
jgi:RHS repeat-associated protein